MVLRGREGFYNAFIIFFSRVKLQFCILDIKRRRLDVFFELEEKIMSGTTLDK